MTPKMVTHKMAAHKLETGAGVALTALLMAGCASAPTPPTAMPKAGAPPAMLSTVAGYLPAGAAPSSLSLLPPPPMPGSGAHARDEEASKVALAQHGGPRWEQATLDADLAFPAAAETFACALGIGVSEARTPHVYALMRRSLGDLGRSVYPTKTKYMRARPFAANGAPQCTPALDVVLRRDGSYPSGHSAVGWGWALILAEAAPDRADAILARGRAFGQSRVACNVHWLSDIEEGRVMASAVVAKLHDQAEFQADVAAAKGELIAARAASLKPARDCASEAARLAGG